MFIPRFGINGAACASVLAYVVSILLTARIGRRYFAMPMPPRSLIQVLLATALMGLVLWPLRSHHGFAALSVQCAIGALVYAAVLIGQDFLNLRTSLAGKFRLDSESAPQALHLSAASIAAADVEEIGQPRVLSPE
jgi:O-antigen/teichoic acid export membrane protein